MKMISSLLKVSVVKTLCFNLYYFPFKTAIRFPVIVARNFKLKALKGEVVIPKVFEMGGIRLGFGDMGHLDTRTQPGIWQNYGIVEFKGNAAIGLGSRISVNSSGVLEFGGNFNITAKSTILVEKKIVFGDNCLLSWDVLIMDTDFHPIYNAKDEEVNPAKEIVIGNKVWIGCRVLVLKGSTVESGCVIGAGSKVSGHLNVANSIYAGEPLEVKRNDIRWGN